MTKKNEDRMFDFMNEDATAHCDQCQRKTYSSKDLGRKCGMPQPNGKPCSGIFIKIPQKN